jgi:hypothetical protein
MDANLKRILKALSLELRHLLEGEYDATGQWHGGDLERRLNALGVWRDRDPLPADELPPLTPADRQARDVVDAYLELRHDAGIPRDQAVAEFVRETAYTWANRLLALRCMEARGLIDEVILQKSVYGGRSLEHHRLARRNPELCVGEDAPPRRSAERGLSRACPQGASAERDGRAGIRHRRSVWGHTAGVCDHGRTVGAVDRGRLRAHRGAGRRCGCGLVLTD